MKEFLETQVSNSETISNGDFEFGDSKDEVKLELVPREIRDGEKIKVGKSTLVYSEDNTSKAAKRGSRKIENLKNSSFLPKEIMPEGNCLINESDNGRFIGLSVKEGSAYFVKFRSFKIGDVPKSAENFETILTSQCIFGFGDTKAKLSDGSFVVFRNGRLEPVNNPEDVISRHVIDWDIDDRISVYELEALYRKVSFINALFSDSTDYSKIILNNPRVEYYLSGLNIFQQGLLSQDLLLKWFDFIDQRSDRINKLTQDRLHLSYSVTSKPPLEELRTYLRGRIVSNCNPVLDDAFVILSQNKLWDEAISFKRPTSWIDLVEMAEAVEELRDSFENKGGTVIIKSPKHEITFGHAGDIAEFLHTKYNDSFNLMAMYPHERIIVSHDTPQRTLLSHIPEAMSISSAKEVIRQYNLNIK